MRQILQLAAATFVFIVLLTSCAVEKDAIVVVTREDGSGTRAAMTELMELGADTDITPRAEVVGSNAVMLFSVLGCDSAIGYVSAGAMAEGVKGISINGVSPTQENIRSGVYPMKRNFLLVMDDSTSQAAQDFLRFSRSPDAANIINEAGYVPPDKGDVYTSSGSSGKVILAGSTSVAPVVEALADAYVKKNPDVHIEVQQTGSSAGISSVLEGVADIGMSSRELTDAERGGGLQDIVVAYDGIAVITHESNPVTNLSIDQVRRIFSGEIVTWQTIYGK
ncbi:MAG: phosphate ABC transporter substrate-binding protein [Clostridiales bacterium]|jgi:phosphate transport system substrate-binding protein|nr:phosphate ABC transporter substrate-binding protein [Clostridiales bacterium]